MQSLRLLAILMLVSVLSACAATPSDDERANPLASFARMEGGEWRMGTIQFDTWSWGPGRHSMRSLTHGSDGSGSPWRELLVVYWHPGRREVRLFGMHPDIPGLGRGVMEGTIEFEGDTANAVFDLHQPGHPGAPVRALALRWTFDGPDAYHETLSESTGLGDYATLAEWDHVRSTTLTAPRALPAGGPPRPSNNLEVFEPLLGRTWEAVADGHHLQSTFEWVPYLDVIALRTMARADDAESTHVLDAYLYHHVGTDTLRCLALSESGGVYEGDVTVEGGALRMDLAGYEGQRIVPYVVRLDFEADGTLRTRVRSRDGTLSLDVHAAPMQ
ncbi:MAG: hypothetical protein ACYTGP_10460 [Planctomycetota bacterium]|jgi:hypothetical protein